MKEYKETISRERFLTKEAAYSELKNFMLRLFQKLGYEMEIGFRDDHETGMRTVVARWEEKPLTNANRIRAMSDEELAEYLRNVENDDGYANDWLDWLRQEAT